MQPLGMTGTHRETDPVFLATGALLSAANVFTADQSILKPTAAIFTTETTDNSLGAEVRVKIPLHEWAFYTGYNSDTAISFYDRTNNKFPFRIEANAPDRSFVIKTTTGFVGMGTDAPGSALHTIGALTLSYSIPAYNDRYYIRLTPNYAEGGMDFFYGTTRIFYTKEYNTPTALRVALNLVIDTVKSGATQVAAGATAGEVWKTSGHATLPDNVLMIGV